MFYTVDTNNFTDMVLDASGMVLVNFWATWNSECGKMSALLRKMEGLLDEQDAIVQIDWNQQKQLARKLDIVGVPTLCLYVGGLEVARYFGKMEKEELIQTILEAKLNSRGKED